MSEQEEPGQKLRELQETVRILLLENQQLAERSEDTALLGLISEKINSLEDAGAIIHTGLEHISMLKNIPLCACCDVGSGKITVLKSFAAFCNGDVESCSFPVSDDLLQLPFILFSEEDIRKSGISIKLCGREYLPSSLLVIPCSGLAGASGAFVFADNVKSNRFEEMQHMLRRVVESIMARLDNAFLVKTLQELNENLDLRVEERTQELLSANRALGAEMAERVRVEEELRESERKYRNIIRNLEEQHFLYVHNTAGIFTYISPSIERMLGYTPEEFCTHYSRYLTDNPVNAEVVRHTELSIRGEKQPPYPIEIYHKNGGVRWLEVMEIPIFSDDGAVKAVQGIAADITDRKKAEAEREGLERQMQQTQKLESLGVLAGGIAHDFNNLLMAIMGNAGLALMKLQPESPVRDNLEHIETASLRAADLCKQMLAYAGKGQFVLERVDLSALVEDMARLLKTSISKKAVLNLDLQRGLPFLQADPGQIRQIVMNLIINASEAIGEQTGVITVCTGAMEYDPDYFRETYLGNEIAAGTYVYIEVSDTGCGIDKETQHKIFEPFFTTKFTGRGLGLSAVLGVIRAHKGALRLYSEPGMDTTFRALFPGLPAGEKELQRPAAAGSTEWMGSGMVLLVDDEEIVRNVGSELLEALGFSVLTAADGQEAVEIYVKRRGEIALVLLDMTMPRMDGAETFMELRRHDPGAKVIISSGFAEQDVMARFDGKGVAGFIQKPYTPGRLKAELRRVINNEGTGPG